MESTPDVPLPSKERQRQFLEDYRRFFINPMINKYYGGQSRLKDLALPTMEVSYDGVSHHPLSELSSYGRADFHLMYSDFYHSWAFRNDLDENFRRLFASLVSFERALREDTDVMKAIAKYGKATTNDEVRGAMSGSGEVLPANSGAGWVVEAP